jgi:dienelactone hydrolase
MQDPVLTIGLLAGLAMAATVPVCPAWADDSEFIIEDMMLPAAFKGGFGTTDRVNLEATVVRPADGLPHPLALMNHGMTSEPDERHEMSAHDMIPQAEEFARRGWTVLIPMRRDYGKSGGEFAEDLTGQYCGSLGYDDEGRAAAEDLKEAARAISQKSYVDRSKMISVGISGGGFATVALTADPPSNLLAAISFAGGEGSSTHGMYCSFNELIQDFANFGRHAHTPSLWVYAQNDHFFSPGQARDFVKAYDDAGGKAQLIIAPPFGDEGHYLFTQEGISIWSKYVDDFLTAQHLDAASLAADAKKSE